MSKYYNNKKTMGPRVFAYSDKHSVRACSKNDLIISFKENIIGKDGSSAMQGENVLIIGKKEKEIVVFSAKVGKYVHDGRQNTWYDRGGNKWKYNYEIYNKTEPVTISKKELLEITGVDKSKLFQVFEPRFAVGIDKPNSPLKPTIEGRKKLLEFLRKK
mgnify:CR=1 FL=1